MLDGRSSGVGSLGATGPVDVIKLHAVQDRTLLMLLQSTVEWLVGYIGGRELMQPLLLLLLLGLSCGPSPSSSFSREQVKRRDVCQMTLKGSLFFSEHGDASRP